MTVTVRANGTQVWTGTAEAFQQAAAQDIKTVVGHPIAPNETVTLNITAALPANTDASFQGRQISQPITWQFSAPLFYAVATAKGRHPTHTHSTS